MEDIDFIVEQLNLQKVQIKKNELHCLCINPDHDDKHIGNFSINLLTGTFYCFGCGYKGNVIAYLREKGVKSEKIIQISHVLHGENQINWPPTEPLDKYIIDSIIRNNYSEYAIKRLDKFDNNQITIIEYNVFQDNEGNPIFFICDNMNRPWGYYTRIGGKYILVEPLGLKDSGLVFGQHLLPEKYTVVCEDFFSTMAVRAATGYKAVGTMGTKFTEAQVKSLKRMQPLIIAGDGDYAGKKFRDSLFDVLIDCNVSVVGNYIGDLDELSPDDIRKVFEYHRKEKVEYLIFRKNRNK